jgi:hypothetical protein
MKNDHRSGKTYFVLKKTRIVTKKPFSYTFLKNTIEGEFIKKIRKTKKNCRPILDLKGWWSHDHVTPNISGQGWKSNKPYGDVK